MSAFRTAPVLTDGDKGPRVGYLNRYSAASGAITLRLPSAAGVPVGSLLSVEKVDDSANAVTVTVHDEFYSGGSSVVLSGQRSRRVFTVVGAAKREWAVVSAYDERPGEPGEPGTPGKSAYEIALDNGFEGTEQDWLESLKGEPGDGISLSDVVSALEDNQSDVYAAVAAIVAAETAE